VRPGGRIALLDASEPDNPILRAGHGVYFNRIVPVIGGTLSNKTAYSYLPKSMAYLPSVDEMLSMLADAGFPGTERRQLSGGLTQLFVGTRA
jgi:demethylmenaquinone methyltransferase/2-methoxy-6-polyprenyl-1,4-benzoquinol methylase